MLRRIVVLVTLAGSSWLWMVSTQCLNADGGSAWTSYRGDTCNRACGRVEGVTGSIAWSTRVESGPTSEVVTTPEGMGFVSVRRKPTETRVYAFRCSDGGIVWNTSIVHAESFLVVPAPAVDIKHNKLYVSCLDGRLVALDTTDGHQIWSYGNACSETIYVSSPKVYEGFVYYGVDDTLYALDSLTGQLHWSQQIDSGPVKTPAVCEKLYVATGKFLTAMEPRSGRVLWKTPCEGQSCPVVDGRVNRVYVVGTDMRCYAYSSVTGKQLWATKQLFLGYGIAVQNGVIFAASNFGREGVLYAIDAERGVVLWSYSPITGAMISPCCVDDGHTVYTTILPKVLAVDTKTHAKKWAVNLRLGMVASSPSIGWDGKLYIANGEGGVLFALR